MNNNKYFSIIGCQHAHIKVFIEDLINLGYKCAGIYPYGDSTLAEQISKNYSIEIVDDYRTLLNESIEIVGCSAINNEKIDIVEICESYNKNIMLDKPVITNWKDYERLEKVINRNKIEIGLLLTERFRPEIYNLKKIIDSKELGEIVSIQMRKPHLLNVETRPLWHFSKEKSGGIIIDLFIHDFDLLRWFTNAEISNSYGFVSKNILENYPDFYDTALAQVKMEDGIIASLYADWHTASKSWTWGDCRIYVTGTKGSAEARLEGDPFIQKEGLLIVVTDNAEAKKIKCNELKNTITKDFINRLNREKHMITHSDILSTVYATLKTEENMQYLNNL